MFDTGSAGLLAKVPSVSAATQAHDDVGGGPVRQPEDIAKQPRASTDPALQTAAQSCSSYPANPLLLRFEVRQEGMSEAISATVPDYVLEHLLEQREGERLPS